MQGFWLLLFLVTAGFTTSGLAANLYRVCGFGVKTSAGRTFRLTVMAVAGPSVLFESAMRGRLAKTWHPVWFWFTIAGISYWSLALGVLVTEVALAL